MPSSPRRCLLIKRLPLRLALSATLSGDFPQAQQLYINILVVNYGSKPFLLMNNNTEKGKGIKLRLISYSHIISIYIYLLYLPFIFMAKKKRRYIALFLSIKWPHNLYTYIYTWKFATLWTLDLSADVLHYLKR